MDGNRGHIIFPGDQTSFSLPLESDMSLAAVIKDLSHVDVLSRGSSSNRTENNGRA